MIRKFFNDVRYKTNLSKSYALMEISKRSVKELFEMRVKIQDLYLKADREEKDSRVLEAQLDLIKWVLGEK